MTTNWRDDALCRDVDPETWFPIGNQGPAAEQIERAKRICLDCPVRVECLSWALDNNEDHGVWGAMDEYERRKLRHRGVSAQHRAIERAAAPPPPPPHARPVVRRETCVVCSDPLTDGQKLYCKDKAKGCKRIAANRQKHFGGSDPWYLAQGTTVLATQDGAA